MKFMSKILTFLALVGTIHAQSSIQNISDNEHVVALAAPFNSFSGISVGSRSCIKDYSIIYSDVKNQITFTRSISHDQLENLLNTKIEGKLGFGKFSGSAKAEFVKSSTEDNYSINANYVEVLSAVASVVEPDDYGKNILNEKGLKAYEEGAPEFLQTCGDSFIASAEAGAFLLVNVNIGFKNRADKAKFEGAISAKIGSLANITGKVDKAAKELGISGSLTIRAIQLGGDPSRLANIFEKGQDGYYFIECDISNTNACAKSINGIIDYAAKDFANQIQFNQNDKKINANELAFWDPNYKRYSDLGIKIRSPNFSREIMAAFMKIDEWYYKDKSDLDYVNHLISAEGMIHFEPDTYSQIQLLQRNLRIRMDNYVNSDLSICSDILKQNECMESYKNLENHREQIAVNREILDYFRKNTLLQLSFVDVFLVPTNLKDSYTWYASKYIPLTPSFTVKFKDNKMTLDGNYLSSGPESHLFSEHEDLITDDGLRYEGTRTITDLTTNKVTKMHVVYIHAVLF